MNKGYDFFIKALLKITGLFLWVEFMETWFLFIKKTKFGYGLEISQDPKFNKVLHQTQAESFIEAKKKIESEYILAK